MKNQALLPVFIMAFLINFVSAAFLPYSSGFSLSSLLYAFDAQTVTLVSIFLIAFILIFIALSKSILKDYRGPSAVIAFALSFLLIFEYNRRGYSYNFGSFFYNVGYSGDISYLVVLVFIGILVLSISKLGVKNFFLISWILLLALSLPISDIVYEKGVMFFLALIFFILWFITLKLEKKKNPWETTFRSPYSFLYT